ncbi:sulfurtransferase [Cellulophaga sp. L1A9]|uniref:sulfurtransferase n=1 Tax=Cellulophaga sp. L1A9 TaxID=2686362 RepID=UPI00131C64FD|nr:sulfurtransferase [Cellulophaga sp. L1A9]
MDSLVTGAWLKNHLKDTDVVILEASAVMNASGSKIDSDQDHIVGARLFDLKNDFSDSESTLPNMLPSAVQFEKECQKLGINTSSKVVVYDTLGVYWSPRVWWMFKAMGHENVAVLDGGLPSWKECNYPIEKSLVRPIVVGNFKAMLQQDCVVNFETVFANSETGNALLIDARSQGRFNGTELEPRKDLRSGSIPNSVNIPYTTVIDHGKFKSKIALEPIFESVKKEDRSLIFSCGSGVTACIVLLASTLVLDKKNSVYDGSWTEWAQKVN